MGCIEFRRDGRIPARDQWQSNAGAKVLSLQSKARCRNFCPSGARSLGRRKQTPLGHGCFFQGRPEPRSGRLRRREFSHLAEACLESAQTGENKKTRNKRQNAQRWLGPSLSTQIAGCRAKGNLDASALAPSVSLIAGCRR